MNAYCVTRSAPAERLYQEFGLTSARMAEAARVAVGPEVDARLDIVMGHEFCAEVVQPVDRSDNIVPLIIDATNEFLEVSEQAPYRFFPAAQDSVEFCSHCSKLLQSTAVENERQRGEHFFGGRILTGALEWNHVSVSQAADGLCLIWNREFEVLGPEHAGLGELGVDIGRYLGACIKLESQFGAPIVTDDMTYVPDDDVVGLDR